MHKFINADQAICKCGVIGYKQENDKVKKNYEDHIAGGNYLKATNRFTVTPNFSCVFILRIAENLHVWSETLSKFNCDLRWNRSGY